MCYLKLSFSSQRAPARNFTISIARCVDDHTKEDGFKLREKVALIGSGEAVNDEWGVGLCAQKSSRTEVI